MRHMRHHARLERVVTAPEQLSLALLELADRGERAPCQGRRRDRWTSDDAVDRSWAASVCLTLGCPVLEECGAAADEQHERYGVWGGRDHTATVPKRKAPSMTADTPNGLQEPHTEKDPQ